MVQSFYDWGGESNKPQHFQPAPQPPRANIHNRSYAGKIREKRI